MVASNDVLIEQNCTSDQSGLCQQTHDVELSLTSATTSSTDVSKFTSVLAAVLYYLLFISSFSVKSIKLCVKGLCAYLSKRTLKLVTDYKALQFIFDPGKSITQNSRTIVVLLLRLKFLQATCQQSNRIKPIPLKGAKSRNRKS